MLWVGNRWKDAMSRQADGKAAAWRWCRGPRSWRNWQSGDRLSSYPPSLRLHNYEMAELRLQPSQMSSLIENYILLFRCRGHLIKLQSHPEAVLVHWSHCPSGYAFTVRSWGGRDIFRKSKCYHPDNNLIIQLDNSFLQLIIIQPDDSFF